MKSSANLDVFRDSDDARARAARVAADTARHDPFWTDEERQRRAAYYEAEAQRLERATGGRDHG